ncbi:questin oxidase family protein [Photorhabdus temperata]|uniref:DUF4243 domain-containing protein n=1 Tax=Photorhabdus temperata subsp. temperata Meg1 TaxID=1393735 RepID=A0A081S0S5_PHOTE|nr:questin oxidase family protein [Photorhabdus temperata]EQB99034.1 hypothetical protein B738_20553 [Photorhabdus temperata subsp. temperata M1021]KER04528.1 Protein of unknown function (DUF4243) [Photorhabdus temperata subsp. temperata Meg1]MCT8346876.1 questin oxidase family protein [Photorhabdus temperata]
MINKLLNDRSYHIEFNGHLTNHVKHAVIALHGLGISAGRIKDYYDNYAKLTPYGMGLEPPKTLKHVIDSTNWKYFLGKRTSYSSYCDYFEEEIKNKGIEQVLQEYMPTLLSGWAGALTHGTIHLGWALDIDHPWMIIEGLAYMAFSYVPCHSERAFIDSSLNDKNAFDSILRISMLWEERKVELTDWVNSLVDNENLADTDLIHPELRRSGLQYRIARLLMQGHPEIYRLPVWIETQNAEESWAQLFYVITLIYLAKPGDFLLLHLITSLFAMRKISARLPAEESKNIIKCYWVGMLCILFSTTDLSKPAKFSALNQTYSFRQDEITYPLWEQEWTHIIARALEEEEEHNPKLVYVMNQLWKEYGLTIYRAAANQFTSTPLLPPSFEEAPIE